MPDVVVLGSLNMDLVVRAEHMPVPGETVRGEQFITVPGGKGANQAAAAARLGAVVEMVGRVGQDAFGAQLLDNLHTQGVGVVHVSTDDQAPTGIAMIVLDAAGENSIVVASGANGRVDSDDLLQVRALIAEARYLVLQLEVPLPVVFDAIRLAARVGTPVILNAAPAHPVDPTLLRSIACLVVNESEAHMLTDIAVADAASARQAAGKLIASGVAVVIVTLGDEGAVLVGADYDVHIPAQPVQVVDTTGAGDAFVGALAAARVRGFGWLDAARYANCAGALATTVLGAQPSLPSTEQVEAIYRGDSSE